GQSVHRPTANQETASVENAGTTTAGPSEQGRRRHTQKQQSTPPAPLAQADATPIAESASTVEPAAQPEGVAPEDLPPLEYSELKKAHPRRRRRHRPGPNSNLSASSAASKSPAAAAVPPPPVPPSVGAPAYSIVSGYTVSQMNQG